MITLDTSGLLALLDRRDPDHEVCMEVMRDDGGPFLIPLPILSEIGWFLERRFPVHVTTAFLRDLQSGAYNLAWDDDDTGHMIALANRFSDLPLGIADASVVAVAQRHGGRCLSLDHHFVIVARGERGLLVLPS